MAKKKIKILIIDDSFLVRESLNRALSKDSELEIVGASDDVYTGREMIVKFKPDVIILNIEIPRMDGIEFLRRLMPQHPIPVVVITSKTQKGKHLALHALESGAVDFVVKLTSDIETNINNIIDELREKIKIASLANVTIYKNLTPVSNQSQKHPNYSKLSQKSQNKIIAIGASTGGTEAIRKVIEELPVESPGIVVVQDLPKGFTKIFADRLNEVSKLDVKEAETGDKVFPGKALIAPGDSQMKIIKSGDYYTVVCNLGEKVNGKRPSIDVLFFSIAEHAGENGVGIILTGTGEDGVLGMRAIHDAGGFTICQDEDSSLFSTLPIAVFEIGAADLQLPVDRISSELLHHIFQS